MDPFAELSKALDVKLCLEDEKNEFGESVLTCEGHFPTVQDRPVLSISAPPKDWLMLARLEAEDWKTIVTERFLIPMLAMVRTHFPKELE